MSRPLLLYVLRLMYVICFCTANGSWAEWSTWDRWCTVLHYPVTSRVRSCTNPPPTHGGTDCEGARRETALCVGT